MAKKKGRYGHIKKHKYDGHTFDSKKEMLRYMELKLAERAGVIGDLVVHPRIQIIIGGVIVKYPDSFRPLTYEADFRYYDHEKRSLIWEDVKMTGHRTNTYKIKRALVAAMGINILET